MIPAPTKRSGIELFLPDSFLDNTSTLMLKTMKIGIYARIFNIFRIDKVIFYNNGSNPKDKAILNDVLSYLNLPPYLRKYVPLTPNLKFSAIIPPIKSPNHTGILIQGKKIKEGHVIKKKLTNSSKIEMEVDVGEMVPLRMTISSDKLEFDEITDEIIVDIEARKILLSLENDCFWKFEFKTLESDFSEYIQRKKGINDLVLAATRLGDLITDANVKSKLQQNINRCGKIFVLFGPLKGLFSDYLDKINFNKNLIDHWINFIPYQGTLTVKLEDAILSSLAILNIL
jgi:predicted SPOUT superfamily RNA methylase MTH1